MLDEALEARFGGRFFPREVEVERRADGTLVLHSPVPLGPVAKHVPAYLRHWAAIAPERTWIAQRRGPNEEWRRIGFGEARRLVDGLTQSLLDLGGPEAGTLLILSGNSLEHALITIAAMQARIPVVPVSPAYSLLSTDFAKLKHIWGLVRPGFVLVDDAPRFAAALRALDIGHATLIHTQRGPEAGTGHAFDELAARTPGGAVEESVASIRPDDPARILFTSGSTGMPKGAINTHYMTCANIAAATTVRPRFGAEDVQSTLSWLPWSHTMGSSNNLLRLLAEGGSLYLDEGRPTPEQFAETRRNLADVPVTYYSSVPAGYGMLTGALEQDDELASTFFSRLKTLSYGGSTLSNDIYARLQRLAVRHTGHEIFFATAWGATELGPNAASLWWPTRRAGIVGLPLPGVSIKLIPHDDRYEMRVGGHGLLPGYWNDPDKSKQAFDEEGFYITGDAGRLVDPDDPSQGLEFAGRIVEDFKLATGVFVNTGPLRIAALAATAPVLHDAVVTGHDRNFVGLLAWLNLHASRDFVGNTAATVEELVRHPRIIEHVRKALQVERTAAGSSSKIARVLLMAEPPSVDGNELTDKGYINQRATLMRRADLVERLHAARPDPDVIVINP